MCVIQDHRRISPVFNCCKTSEWVRSSNNSWLEEDCYVLSAPHFIQTLIHKDCPGFTLPQCRAVKVVEDFWDKLLLCWKTVSMFLLFADQDCQQMSSLRPASLKAFSLFCARLACSSPALACVSDTDMSGEGKNLPCSVGACGYFYPSKQTSRRHFASLGGGERGAAISSKKKEKPQKVLLDAGANNLLSTLHVFLLITSTTEHFTHETASFYLGQVNKKLHSTALVKLWVVEFHATTVGGEGLIICVVCVPQLEK